MKNNLYTYNKEFQQSLNKTFKNYICLKNYIELTNKMISDYNLTISEYESISQDYIKKLTQLSSKYSDIISQYEKTLVYSDGKLKDLLKLFYRIPAIFSLQCTKLQSIQVVIKECCANSGLNDDIKKSNNKFEELKQNFENEDKKINKNLYDLEMSNKNLFDAYKNIEDSLANIVISNEKHQKKFSMNDIMMQNIPIIDEKENIFINAKKDLIKNKKDYFKIYDKFINFSQKKFKDNIHILQYNITTFATIFLTYFKTAHSEMEQTIKSISENETKMNYSKITENLLTTFDRGIPDIKYSIRLVNDKYIEDKNNSFDHQKLRKEHYLIKDDKIYLKIDDIYEIVKMMFGQFRFIEEKNYNLAEEQKKVRIKNLTDKLLSYNLKNQNIFDLDSIPPLKDEEVDHLIMLLNKPGYRFDFLKILNLFRAQGNCEMPPKEFEITKKIFLFIADKIKEETDVLSAKLILILSQTFYVKEKEEKIYIFKYLKNHDMLSNLDVWSQYLNEMIEEDLNRSNINEIPDEDSKDTDKLSIINNVLLAHMLTFCHNMIEFGMKEENIKRIIEPVLTKYRVKEDSLKQINDLLENEIKGKEGNNNV